ncbi:MAG: adenylate/guanylate cyclase domain-containing protein [Saprospiraceae bacterium]
MSRVFNVYLLSIVLFASSHLYAERPQIILLEPGVHGEEIRTYHLFTVPYTENRDVSPDNTVQDSFHFSENYQIHLVKPGVTYWLKFHLQNTTPLDKEWILSFDAWSYVDFYYKDSLETNYHHKQSGTLLPFNDRDYPKGNNNFILIPTSRNQTIECLVKLSLRYSKADYPPINLNFKIYERFQLDRYEATVRQYISIFLGIFLVMFLFNLFVYISTRDINYLYYLGVLLMFMLTTADISGYNVSIMKWMPSFPYLKDFFNIIIVTLISFFSVLFCRKFLAIPERYPFWDKIFKILMVLFVADVFILLYDFRFGTDISNIVSVLFILTISAVIIKSVKDRYPSAVYLLIAMIFTIIGSFITIFAQLGILPMNDFNMKYALPIGSCIEMVLFSFALGYRINLLKKENEQKQLKIISQLKENELIQLSATQELERKVSERTNEIKIQKDIIQSEKEKSEKLLLNILPKSTSEELMTTGKATPRSYESATVMFTDYVLFTAIAEKLTPKELVEDLDYCFGCFDDIINKYGLEKIKTIGDAYMCVGGVPVPTKTHATSMVYAGLEIQSFMKEWKKQKLAKGQTPFELRVGIHSGPLTAGVVGKQKFAFDIWGSTVNLASRLEAGGESDRVNISGATYELVKSEFNCEYRGKIAIKNKGEIDMYFVLGPIIQKKDTRAEFQSNT